MNKTGILLIHGFAGNIQEIESLREYLTQKGYTVATPILPGHDGTKKELAESSRFDWIDSIEKSYLDLARDCSKIAVIGFSMGGLLAVNLWNYGFAGLITINTPVYYWNPKRIAINLISDFKVSGKRYLKASTDKTFSSMLEFQKLLTNTKPMFRNITCKTLVVQALDDDTVYYKSADYIFKRICAEKYIYKSPKGGHMIFQSKNGQEVCHIIGDFIQSL